jgi:protein O-GlcNAc transferase
MNKPLTILTVLIAVFALAGCSAKDNHKTQREQAGEEWNTARAAVLSSLARDQFSTGNFEKCQETLNDAIPMDPTNAELQMLQARLDIETGKLESAERVLKQAQALRPNDAEIDYLMGVVNQRWQRTAQAIACYEAASTKKPEDPAFLLAKAEALVLAGEIDAALKSLMDRVVYFEHSAAIRDAIGQLLEEKGMHAEASEYFRQASVLDSEDAGIRERLALSLYREGKHNESLAQLNRLLKRDSHANRTDLLQAAGECLLQMGRNLDARNRFDTAMQIEPSNVPAMLGVAKSSIALRDYRRAELVLAKALAINSSDVDTLMLVGFCRLEQDRLDDALAAFRRANAIDGRDTVALCMIGLIHQKQGRPVQAIEMYGQALAINSKDELAGSLMASVKN